MCSNMMMTCYSFTLKTQNYSLTIQKTKNQTLQNSKLNTRHVVSHMFLFDSIIIIIIISIRWFVLAFEQFRFWILNFKNKLLPTIVATKSDWLWYTIFFLILQSHDGYNHHHNNHQYDYNEGKPSFFIWKFILFYYSCFWKIKTKF